MSHAVGEAAVDTDELNSYLDVFLLGEKYTFYRGYKVTVIVDDVIVCPCTAGCTGKTRPTTVVAGHTRYISMSCAVTLLRCC